MNNISDLSQYLIIGLKWSWLLILTTGIGAAIGHMVSQQEPPVYQATTTIIVGQSIQSMDLNSTDLMLSERLARTYADMALRQPVLEGVVSSLELNESWKALRGRIFVKPVRDTQLLEIRVEAGSPETARLIADEVANQLILLSPTALQNQAENESQSFIRQRVQDLQAKIEAGQTRLGTLEDSMSGTLSAEQVQEIQEEINNLESLIAEWENNYTQLLIFIEGNKSPNYLAVIEPAQASNAPIRPNPRQSTMMAGIVGLLLAGGIVFLIEYLDDTLKTPDDISYGLELTLLGKISQIKGKDSYGKLITSDNLFSPVSEAYRIIRSNIQFTSVDQPLKSILITSPMTGEGKSLTTANLGIVMAQAGFKTIIVDTDLRRPTQHEIFQIPNQSGVTDWLFSAEDEVNLYLHKTSIENLSIMTSGVIPPNPSELLGSQRMETLLDTLTHIADLVIYDSPPTLAVADGIVLSNQVDGVVLVVQAKKTRLEAARQAIITLDQAGANLIGSILNRTRDRKNSYYYYNQRHSANGYGPAQPLVAPQPQRRRQKLSLFK